jgi:phosphate starvation-inducible protein PhoH and related proteins
MAVDRSSIGGSEEVRVPVAGDSFPVLAGERDRNLNLIEKHFGVRLVTHGDEIIVHGDQAERVAVLLRDLVQSPTTCTAPTGELEQFLQRLARQPGTTLHELLRHEIVVGRRRVVPRSLGQVAYLEAIADHDMVFGIGPAGTGKTYLAMATAIHALRERQVNRIVLTRPAVEAGESLGFLPGDMLEKLNPYLRPLYDALYDMVPADKAAAMLEHGTIEIAPLAFMRGRTLNDAFIILDEAQNCTSEQMKMFLTRMGFNSKVVVTGDITQIDLAQGQVSGLKEVREVMSEVSGVAFVYLDHRDVVRHPLVQRVIQAYDEHHARRHGHR